MQSRPHPGVEPLRREADNNRSARDEPAMLGQAHLDNQLTEAQRAAFERDGYLHVPDALDAQTVLDLEALVDAIYRDHRDAGFDPYTQQSFAAQRPFFFPNFLKEDQRFVNLLDCAATFPLVWGLLGWNIYSYHSHFIVTPPGDPGDERTGRFGFHRDSGRANVELEGSPQPRLSLKVSFWLSDATAADRGNLFVIPGSHLVDWLDLPADGALPEEAVPVLAAPGDAVLFDRRTFHSASPNVSDVTRKALFIGYGYRWLRPKDDMTIGAEMLRQNDPVRRQLLGDDTDANGKFSPKPGAVPLREWLLEQGLLER